MQDKKAGDPPVHARNGAQNARSLRWMAGLRDGFAGGYSAARFRTDAMAGIVVGVVAIPLSMALAIACGVPPQYGLYTAIIAGGLVAAFGGSSICVTGPTAAFVALLAPIAARYGLGGLAVASVMAGAILIAMGLLRFGAFVHFVPHPVVTGFTSGIAVIIATLQLKDFFGLQYTPTGADWTHRIGDTLGSLSQLAWPDTALGVGTLILLALCMRYARLVPPALIAMPVAALVAVGMQLFNPDWSVATLGTNFTWTLADGASGTGIPPGPPLLAWPWDFPGADGRALGLSYELVRALMPSALAIALLGALSSLLCAVVADGMAGTSHDPDSELIGQGIGNLVAPFFGGFAASGAIARTGAGIRAGARSPIAAVVHALFVLATLLLLGQWLSYLPMAALAALLLMTAWRIADAQLFVRTLKVAPRSDSAVLLTCFSLTVAFDMILAVVVGMMLAAVMFLRRMATQSGAHLIEVGASHVMAGLPKDVLFYEVRGPMFFGAAEKAMADVQRSSATQRMVILDLEDVPMMDMTGLAALEAAIRRLNRRGTEVVLLGAQQQPRELLERAGCAEAQGKLHFCADHPAARAYATRTRR